MTLIETPTSVRAVDTLVRELREAHRSVPPLMPHEAVQVLDAWGARLARSPLIDTAGAVFLTLWLRLGTLQPLLERELGSASLEADWQQHGRTRSRPLPLGVIGHFPAANVPIQPLLSLTCGVLGGNASLVRVPCGAEALVDAAAQLLDEVDPHDRIMSRLRLVTIPSDRRPLLSAMAAGCDGAMIWGGEEAVLAVRSLPFPHWARIATFGPRVSAAVMDAATCSDSAACAAACQRLARDVWQFEQRACSSPQVLYVERHAQTSVERLLDCLEAAFVAENAAHPRLELEAAAAAAIARARADWLIAASDRSARYPSTPDWTILAAQGSMPPVDPVQCRCLIVCLVDDLVDPISTFDGSVQTLGLGCRDAAVERRVVRAACERGVDRITQLGRMHVFDSPWDGRLLVAPMTRLVRYTPSTVG